MTKTKKYYRSWLIQAPASLLLVGLGVSLVSEAAMLKYSGANSWQWVLYGTAALIVLNSGLCLFGNAILFRMRYEQAKDKKT